MIPASPPPWARSWTSAQSVGCCHCYQALETTKTKKKKNRQQQEKSLWNIRLKFQFFRDMTLRHNSTSHIYTQSHREHGPMPVCVGAFQVKVKFFFFTIFMSQFCLHLQISKLVLLTLASSPRKPDRATTRSFPLKFMSFKKEKNECSGKYWTMKKYKYSDWGTNMKHQHAHENQRTIWFGGPRARLCGWGRKSETLAIYCWLLNFLLCSSKGKMATIGIKYFTFRRGEKANLGRLHKLCHMWEEMVELSAWSFQIVVFRRFLDF